MAQGTPGGWGMPELRPQKEIGSDRCAKKQEASDDG